MNSPLDLAVLSLSLTTSFVVGKVLGFKITFGAVASTVSAYVVILWSSIVYPAIQEYTQNTLEDLLDRVNGTIADELLEQLRNEL